MVTTRRNSDDDVPNFEAMINAAMANALPNLMAALRTQITMTFRNGAEIQVVVVLMPILKGFKFGSREFWEYMERFTRLASFVGATAGDAQRQARHFKWGLKKWVLDRIVNTDYTNVAQVAAAARNIELLHDSGNSNKRIEMVIDSEHGTGANRRTRVITLIGQHEYRGPQDQSVEHGSSGSGTESLLNFASSPLVLPVESLIQQRQSMPADFARLPPTTGRVYATTRDQAAKTSGTITGTLYIDDRTVFVLFDTGATHSIISTTFPKKLNMTPTPLIER
ncbi:zinc finger, CCHC-type, retrotransposon gag domain protein [Tanacetum coccineum]